MKGWSLLDGVDSKSTLCNFLYVCAFRAVYMITAYFPARKVLFSNCRDTVHRTIVCRIPRLSFNSNLRGYRLFKFGISWKERKLAIICSDKTFECSKYIKLGGNTKQHRNTRHICNAISNTGGRAHSSSFERGTLSSSPPAQTAGVVTSME